MHSNAFIINNYQSFITSFFQLGLTDSTLKAIEETGYTEPTPIQAQAIPSVLQGRDILASAQTGTGKTAAFTLPAIDILIQTKAKARMPRVLIIEPTRELAAQVAENFDLFSKYTDLTRTLLIGGESFVDQEKELKKGVDFLIATPGRLLDLFERGKILLSGIQMFVIDEADRMLDMGFIPDIERIASMLPTRRQNLLFSATMPPPIKKLAAQFLVNPKEIEVAPPATTAKNIEQYYTRSLAKDKRETLRQLIDDHNMSHAIVFCNRKRDIEILKKSMDRHGFKADTLHGDMKQSDRNETLKKFKANELDFLLASDVAARGIDIDGLPFVINFDVPHNSDDYVHRIGRTGRAGKTGHAFMLVSPSEEKALVEIQKLTGKKIDEYHPKVNVVPDKPKQSKVTDHRKVPEDKKDSYKSVVGFGDDIPEFMKFKA